MNKFLTYLPLLLVIYNLFVFRFALFLLTLKELRFPL